MTVVRRRRAACSIALAPLGLMAVALWACATDDPASGADAGADSAADGSAAPVDGAASPTRDGGADGAPSDAASDARAKKDANGPGLEDAGCAFNRDCTLALRCACDQGDCRCSQGARGTGQVGVDRCDGGDDCESSVCVEGPGGVYYCTDECVTESDCAGALPKCADIAFVGRICIR